MRGVNTSTLSESLSYLELVRRTSPPPVRAQTGWGVGSLQGRWYTRYGHVLRQSLHLTKLDFPESVQQGTLDEEH